MYRSRPGLTTPAQQCDAGVVGMEPLSAASGTVAGERLGTPTIADVAAHAGVGVATVSRVVNGRANVAAPTRERVLSAIRELNYRPSSIARNLSLRRTFVSSSISSTCG
jgi:Bacterial regulatory proteins, lacI family